jgi:3-keto-5-aminohexanoate cleavage enzyme
MSREIIITVVPVPGEKQEEKLPGAIDVAEEVIRCEAAGAAIAHLHARDENLLQSTNPTLFLEQVRRIREGCPIILEGSTGAAGTYPQREMCDL